VVPRGRARPPGGDRAQRGAGSLWVPVRAADQTQSGFPRLEAVRRVDAVSRSATTVASVSGRVDVHGLADGGTVVWLADNTNGVLYRLAR
jgi:hypothetical protein